MSREAGSSVPIQLLEIEVSLPPPLLLDGTVRETISEPHSLDFQRRVGRPQSGGDDEPTPCVLILTRTSDPQADDLSLRLAAAGVACLRLDADLCRDEPLCWDPLGGTLATSDGVFSPQVCWRRYFHASALAQRNEPAVDAYLRDQWEAMVHALVATPQSQCLVLNSGAGGCAGGLDRLLQLRGAQAVGLRTPGSLVTNDLRAAAQMHWADAFIVKSVGEHFVEPTPGRMHALLPRRMTRAQIEADRPLEPAPVLVQELIRSERELRIFAVGGTLIGFSMVMPMPKADWLAPETVQVDSFTVPEALADTLRQLMATWHLDVAAFDLLDTGAGNAPVFLEVNPTCDWRWHEAQVGSSAVSDAVLALVLAKLSQRTNTGV